LHSINTDNASNNELRVFAFIAFTGLSFFEWWFTDEWFGYISQVMLVFFVLGLILPITMKYPYKGWMFLGTIMGFIVMRILLSLSYFLVVTPIALYFRLTGRDILKLKKEKVDSYWQEYDAHPKTIERYRKLF
jgi:hypothetical protein